MQKHVIFLVHGMGDFEAGWSRGVASLLQSAYDAFGLSQLARFEERFLIREIEYNHIFEERRQAWKERADAINGILSATGSPTRRRTNW